MKKKYILLVLIFIIILFGINTKVFAADLDEIVNYIVTVDPRMNDGSLDITYEITWKVLDSTTEGPLSWVKIGTPNEYFDTATALSNTIKSIKKYNGSYVRIDFTRNYTAGQQVTFKYSIHQPYMHKVSWGKCKYNFTPAWFTDAKVDNMTIRWNADQVKKSNTKKTEGNYLIWNKTYMAKGEKLTATIQYEKSAFSALSTSKPISSNNSSSGDYSNKIYSMIFAIIILSVIISAFSGFGGGGGYYRHRGFYGGGYYGGGCVRSSCACACAHSSCASSCACACAGSGRAGCSRKDFYGTNLNTKKIKAVLK